jgi:hypothetical protein
VELALLTGLSGLFVALALVFGVLAVQLRRRGAAAARRVGGTAVLMLLFALLMQVGARWPTGP